MEEPEQRTKKKRPRGKAVKRATIAKQMSVVNIPFNKESLANNPEANVTQNQQLNAATVLEDQIDSKEGLINLINSMTSSDSCIKGNSSEIFSETSAESDSKAGLMDALNKFHIIDEVSCNIKKEFPFEERLESLNNSTRSITAIKGDVKKEQDESTTGQLQQQLLNLFDKSDSEQSLNQTVASEVDVQLGRSILDELNTSIETLLEPGPMESLSHSQVHRQAKSSVDLNTFAKTQRDASKIDKKDSAKQVESPRNSAAIESFDQEEPIESSSIVEIPTKIQKMLKKKSRKLKNRNIAEIESSSQDSQVQTLLESAAIEIPGEIQEVSENCPIANVDASKSTPECCFCGSEVQEESGVTDLTQLDDTEKSHPSVETHISSKIPRKKSSKEQDSSEKTKKIVTQEESSTGRSPVRVLLADMDSEDEVVEEPKQWKRLRTSGNQSKEKSTLSSFKIPKKTSRDGEKSETCFNTPLESASEGTVHQTQSRKPAVKANIDVQDGSVSVEEVEKLNEQSNKSTEESETLETHLEESGSRGEGNVAECETFDQVERLFDDIVEVLSDDSNSTKATEQGASEIMTVSDCPKKRKMKRLKRLKVMGYRIHVPIEDPNNYEKENFALFFDESQLATKFIEYNNKRCLKRLGWKLRTSITEFAINCEVFESPFTYNISILEVSTKDEDYVIDCLAFDREIEAYIRIFQDPKIRKVFSSLRSLEILQYHVGVEFVNVFVIELMQKHVDKSFAALQNVHVLKLIRSQLGNHKWTKIFNTFNSNARPLSDQQKKFYRFRTHYLLPTYKSLMHELLKQGEFLCNRFLREAEDLCKFSHGTQTDYLESHYEIEKHQKNQLHVLHELDEWRHYVASSQNVSAEIVLRDEFMKNIALEMPNDMNTMEAAACSSFVSESREHVFKIINPNHVLGPSLEPISSLKSRTSRHTRRRTLIRRLMALPSTSMQNEEDVKASTRKSERLKTLASTSMQNKEDVEASTRGSGEKESLKNAQKVSSHLITKDITNNKLLLKKQAEEQDGLSHIEEAVAEEESSAVKEREADKSSAEEAEKTFEGEVKNGQNANETRPLPFECTSGNSSVQFSNIESRSSRASRKRRERRARVRLLYSKAEELGQLSASCQNNEEAVRMSTSAVEDKETDESSEKKAEEASEGVIRDDHSANETTTLPPGCSSENSSVQFSNMENCNSRAPQKNRKEKRARARLLKSKAEELGRLSASCQNNEEAVRPSTSAIEDRETDESSAKKAEEAPEGVIRNDHSANETRALPFECTSGSSPNQISEENRKLAKIAMKRKKLKEKKKKAKIARLSMSSQINEEAVQTSSSAKERETKCTSGNSSSQFSQDQNSLIESSLAPLFKLLTEQIVSTASKSGLQQPSIEQLASASSEVLMKLGNVTAQAAQTQPTNFTGPSYFNTTNTGTLLNPAMNQMNAVAQAHPRTPAAAAINVSGSSNFNKANFQNNNRNYQSSYISPWINPGNVAFPVTSVPRNSANFQDLPPPNLQNLPPRNFQNLPPRNFQNLPPQNFQNLPPRNFQNLPPPNFQNLPPSLNVAVPPPAARLASTVTGAGSCTSKYNDRQRPNLILSEEPQPSPYEIQIRLGAKVKTQAATIPSGKSHGGSHHPVPVKPSSSHQIQPSGDPYIVSRNPSPPPTFARDSEIHSTTFHSDDSKESRMNSDEENYLFPSSASREPRSDHIQRRDSRQRYDSHERRRRRRSSSSRSGSRSRTSYRARRNRARSRSTSRSRDRKERSSSRGRQGSYNRRKRSGSRESWRRRSPR